MSLKEIVPVRTAAVLGAGVMGAQIAAHLANAKVATILFDLPAKEGDANGLVKRAIKRLGKLKPSPVADQQVAQFITAANYQDNLPELQHCDLITWPMVSKPTTSAVRKVALLGRPIAGPVKASTTSKSISKAMA